MLEELKRTARMLDLLADEPGSAAPCPGCELDSGRDPHRTRWMERLPRSNAPSAPVYALPSGVIGGGLNNMLMHLAQLLEET